MPGTRSKSASSLASLVSPFACMMATIRASPVRSSNCSLRRVPAMDVLLRDNKHTDIELADLHGSLLILMELGDFPMVSLQARRQARAGPTIEDCSRQLRVTSRAHRAE